MVAVLLCRRAIVINRKKSESVPRAWTAGAGGGHFAAGGVGLTPDGIPKIS